MADIANASNEQATGILCGASFATCGTGTDFIQTIYSQRDAIFRGTEVAWQWDLVPLATGIFGVDGQYDFVRATFPNPDRVLLPGLYVRARVIERVPRHHHLQ